MSSDTYKEQMEREKLVLLHYENVTGQLTDILLMEKEIIKSSSIMAEKLQDLSRLMDERIMTQILRLTPEERAMIQASRNKAKE